MVWAAVTAVPFGGPLDCETVTLAAGLLTVFVTHSGGGDVGQLSPDHWAVFDKEPSKKRPGTIVIWALTVRPLAPAGTEAILHSASVDAPQMPVLLPGGKMGQATAGVPAWTVQPDTAPQVAEAGT
jgi:hypothetical protein